MTKPICALALALAALALVVPAPYAAADDPGVQVLSRDTQLLDAGAPAGARAAATIRRITPCTWSYFGDPRAIAYRNWVYTGCIGTDGKVKLDQYNLVSGQKRLLTLFRGLEVDDHNNPSLIYFRRKMYAFASEHAGYVYPRDRDSRMQYRVSKHDFGAGRAWGGTRTIPLDRAAGWATRIPNPVVSGKRMFLFMRGPCWYPYFTSTTDGKTWAAPQDARARARRPRAATCAPTPSTTARPTARS